MQSEEKWKNPCGKRWQAGCAGCGVLGETVCPKGTPCACCVRGAQRKGAAAGPGTQLGAERRVGEGTVHVLGAESTPQRPGCDSPHC